jgi:hypothetical protein
MFDLLHLFRMSGLLPLPPLPAHGGVASMTRTSAQWQYLLDLHRHAGMSVMIRDLAIEYQPSRNGAKAAYARAHLAHRFRVDDAPGPHRSPESDDRLYASRYNWVITMSIIALIIFCYVIDGRLYAPMRHVIYGVVTVLALQCSGWERAVILAIGVPMMLIR